MNLKKIAIGLVVLIALVVTAAFVAQQKINTYLTDPLIDHPLIFTLPSGSSYHSLGNQLLEQHILTDLSWWKVVGKLHPELTHIKSGTYEFENGFTLEQILNTLNEGKEFQYKITFIEGSTFKELLKQLNEVESLTPLNKTEAEVLSALNIPFSKMEGLLHPETYYYSAGVSTFELIKKAHLDQKKIIQKLWKEREAGLPLKNPYEALILASIVEKESGHSADRDKIASVFINRLRVGMRLQTDPTVIYGMGDRYKGKIRTKDLREKTTYNTYTFYGLPPTPIAMPSEEAIYSTLHPAKTKYLYFVSKGNGKSYFSNNLKQHNRAVHKYILGK